MARARTVLPDPSYEELFKRAQSRLPGAEAPQILELRQQAWRRVCEIGLPTSRVEEWKYTSILGRVQKALPLLEATAPPLEQLKAGFAGGVAARRLIFVNGRLVPELSHTGGLPEGMAIASLERLAAQQPDRLAALARASEEEGSAFAWLNAAFWTSGAVVELAEGVRPQAPLQLLFFQDAREQTCMTHPRLVVRLGPGARLHLIESHLGQGDAGQWVNLVSAVELGEGAELVHEVMEAPPRSATLLARSRIQLAAGARLVRNIASLGGGLVRNETEVHLRGPGAEALLNGLYMPMDREHVDQFIRVHHEQPGCHSDQFFKGIVGGKARAVFAGRIMVYRDAQKTNAYQANNNLLLSDEAEVDTKPELEIFADDVKCSHGATVGALDPSALFYLRARGLPQAVAESLLTYAFAGEVLERVVDPHLRGQMARRVLDRVPGGGALEAEGLV